MTERPNADALLSSTPGGSQPPDRSEPNTDTTRNQGTFRLATAEQDFARPGLTVTNFRDRGVHLHVNGWVVSVQWGPGTYSSNHHNLDFDAWTKPAPDATTAEIAAWKDDEGMIPWPDGDTVQGWQTWEQVQAVLDAAERDELPLPPADDEGETPFTPQDPEGV